MSRFTGHCGRGAGKAARESRRLAAEVRNALTPPERRRHARLGRNVPGPVKAPKAADS